MTTKGTRFDSFIKSCTAAKGQSFTHTRIPDKEMKIYGGAYVISEDKDNDFMEQYYEKVFIKGELEYMTEKQLIEDGPNLSHLLAAISTRLIAKKLVESLQLIELKYSVVIYVCGHEDFIDILEFFRLQLIGGMHDELREIVQLHSF